MSIRRLARFSVVAAIALLVPLGFAASPAHATILDLNALGATGTASGNTQSLTHVDTGSYMGLGQIGNGRYRFESTYTPVVGTDSTYTGTAAFTRSDGATLSGTLTGSSGIVDTPDTVDAFFVLDLTHGTRDLVSANLYAECSWPWSVTAGTSGAEHCNVHGTVVVTSRVGYAMVDDHGALHSFGGAPWDYTVSFPGRHSMRIAVTPSHSGYWIATPAGQVSARGDAKSFGSASALHPGEVVRGIAPTAAGDGYWLFTSTGRVLPFGAATFFGDLHTLRLNQPVVAAAAAPDGDGYWMAASDGGVFAFGSARFFGSTVNVRLNQPIVGIAPTADGHGYWLAASDGGVFSFGDAPFRGSMGGTKLNRPVNGVARYGGGYLLVASDDGVFNFSTLPFFGSAEVGRTGFADDQHYRATGIVAVS